MYSNYAFFTNPEKGEPKIVTELFLYSEIISSFYFSFILFLLSVSSYYITKTQGVRGG